MRLSCFSAMRSHLLSTTTSANSTWSLRSCARQRSSSAVACNPRSSKRSTEPSCSRKFAPSTTVTSVSSAATSPRDLPSSSAKVKVSATGSGSEIPEDSTTRWSKRPSFAKAATSFKRSSRSVQQIQPFDISTILSSLRISRDSCNSAASMFTSAMSFTITATRKPSRFSRMCLSIVLLPAPSIPLRTVTGSFATASMGEARADGASPSTANPEPAVWSEHEDAGTAAGVVARAGTIGETGPKALPKRNVSTLFSTAAASASARTRMIRCSSGLLLSRWIAPS
mmetsp:Transcript_88538/g.190063  ORF Transcript_88538/g.190063 Transcript_88538/m.190063 type:complete len:283 (+) Transcript_88538:378-1226(+)